MGFSTILFIFFLQSCRGSGAKSEKKAATGITSKPPEYLFRTWWLMSPKEGCVEYGLTEEGKLTKFHPLSIHLSIPNCSYDYDRNVDLLIVDCSKAGLDVALIYASTRSRCEWHKEKYKEFIKKQR